MSNHAHTSFYLLLVLTSPLILLTGCESNEKAQKVVSFEKEIQPILKKHCLECHVPDGPGQLASGLDMSDYDSLMKGTRFGSVIKAGDSLSSTLVILVEGRADPSIKMPHGDREALSVDEIKSLRSWIDQGAMNN